MTSVSLLIINYRSSALARDAIRSARAASLKPLQVIVVDNSCDPSEADALRDAADAVIVAPRNLGYAGGINCGRRACDGDRLVIANPDVRFGESAIDRLVAVDASVVGPAFFWDDAYEWHLPPAEMHTRAEVADRVLASRSRVWARRRDVRRFRARAAFWQLDAPTRVDAISGAVMVIRAEAFDAAGGFDERYPLYFEENDFVRRVKGEVVYVPAAQCRHLYNQSAAGSTEAAAMYAHSEGEYLRRWGGAWTKRFERERAPFRAHETAGRPFIVEASPLASFETAAGRFTAHGRVDVPDEIWNAYRGNILYMRALAADGGVLATWTRTRIEPQ